MPDECSIEHTSVLLQTENKMAQTIFQYIFAENIGRFRSVNKKMKPNRTNTLDQVLSQISRRHKPNGQHFGGFDVHLYVGIV